jgi:serine protease Do
MIQRIKTSIKPLLALGLTAFLLPGAINAQSDTNQNERIVIIRPTDSKEKLTIEVDGDKVTVNGKDVEKGNTPKGVSVSRTRVNNRTLTGGAMTITSDGDDLADVIVAGYGNKAMLGVTTQSDTKGAKIISVIKGAGAEKAGIKVGDIVTRVDNAKIEKTDDITKAIKDKKTGDKVSVTFLRDGKEQKVTAELSKWRGVSYSYNFDDMARTFDIDFDNIPQPPTPPNTRVQGYSLFNSAPKIGLSVQDTDEGRGVKVLSVEDESVAKKAGILKDDVIMDVDGKAVHNTSDITSLIRDSRTKVAVSLGVERNGKLQTIELRMPRKIRTAEL